MFLVSLLYVWMHSALLGEEIRPLSIICVSLMVLYYLQRMKHLLQFQVLARCRLFTPTLIRFFSLVLWCIPAFVLKFLHSSTAFFWLVLSYAFFDVFFHQIYRYKLLYLLCFFFVKPNFVFISLSFLFDIFEFVPNYLHWSSDI